MNMTQTLKRNGQSCEKAPARQRTYTPRVDILETDEELTLFVDLPGVRTEDMELLFEQSELILRGKVQQRAVDQPLLREYGIGDFHRAFRIGSDIDTTRIQGVLKNGVLTVHLPKAQKMQPRRIEVKS
jgi:HSP20 family molecular chaperone IbpA